MKCEQIENLNLGVDGEGKRAKIRVLWNSPGESMRAEAANIQYSPKAHPDKV